ncbi:ABC transporter permease [Pseudokineococcus sp. 1T1Z-3]|uniref:ABC transporter permease n=1 Tax=Pseudokineococcus sp. 1T1Z-3 TaxID=3132745 RepID=UPI0030B76B72
MPEPRSHDATDVEERGEVTDQGRETGAGAGPGAGTASPAGGPGARGVWPRLRTRASFWVPTGALVVLGAVALAPGFFATLGGGDGDPRVCLLARSVQASATGHPFGFDVQGCDVFANVIYGTRASLSVGLLATAVALVVALVVGTAAGLRDGLLDTALSRLTDVFLGFPFLVGALVVLTSLGDRSVVSVALVLGLFAWPTLARLVRSSVRSVRGAEFVAASRAMGISATRTVLLHVVPNSLGPVLAIATIMVGQVIVAESTLTFLGVGLEAPSISWGRQLAEAQSRVSSAPHLLLWPSLFLTVTVLALISLGDVLRDVLDPRS